MNRTYETICKLVSTAIFGSAISYDEDIYWNDVFEEMKKHGIASIVGDILSDIPMEYMVKEKWKDYIFLQQIYWKKAIDVQDDVSRVLEGIPHVIVKGMSAANNYPNPQLRSMGDIDVLVVANSFNVTNQILKVNNYSIVDEIENKHNSYSKNGILVEIHQMYSRLLLLMGRKEIESKIIAGINNAKTSRYQNHGWNSLPKIENGLSLIEHIYRHFCSGVGFRQIIDWMIFVNSSSDIDWNEFNRITMADGIYELQCVITKMCSLYFGLPQKENIMWMDYADKCNCDKIFDIIAYRGNFGRGMSDIDFRDRLTLKNKTTGLIARLQLGGTIRWKAAKKYEMLRPFAWIYQGCRIIRIIVQRKEPIKAIACDIKESKEIIGLYDKLNIPRVDARGEQNIE